MGLQMCFRQAAYVERLGKKTKQRNYVATTVMEKDNTKNWTDFSADWQDGGIIGFTITDVPSNGGRKLTAKI